MIDKQQLFAEHKKHIEWDAREERVALYFDANPKDRHIYWHLTRAQSGRNYQLQEVHTLVPVSKFESEISLLEQKFGSFKQVGLTYEFEPFLIGIKHRGSTSSEELDLLQRILLTRENCKMLLFNQALRDMSMIKFSKDRKTNEMAIQRLGQSISDSIDRLNDEEYANQVEEILASDPKTLKPVSRKKAEIRAREILASGRIRDEDLIARNAAEANMILELYKKIDYDALTL